MKIYARYLLLSLLLVVAGAHAQSEQQTAGNPTFTQQELDQMLAPIALYPDQLLSQILMAATYPLEIVQAARWSSANGSLSGDAAVQAVNDMNWDPSVKSLVAFPQVLQTMDQKLDWTERLGDAFLAQQSQVMDTVQSLRQKAQRAGNLKSNDRVEVTQDDGSIEVVQARPSVVYVPYYDPMVVYGPWWWPAYPPVYWSPWVGYGWSSGFAWGPGVGIGVNFFFGSWDWHSHRVYVGGYRHPMPVPWYHAPDHRRGVPYRNAALNRQFGRVPPPMRGMPGRGTPAYGEFRGHEPASPVYRNQPGNPGGNRAQPEPRTRTAPPQSQQQSHSQPQSQVRDTHSPQARQAAERPYADSRPHAFENVGRGGEVRDFSTRGNASYSGRAAAEHAPARRPSHPQEH